MSKRRKYDGKSKRGLIIILIVSIVIIGVFSLFIYRYSKASKIKYVIEASSVIQDVNQNFLTIDDDAELRIRWNGNYYLKYKDKNVNLGKKVITYNPITGGMKLYGTFYEIKSDGKIQEYHNETKLANTTNSKFYKLDDREYLMVDSKIFSEDYSIEATSYLLVELDKLGNAKLTNNKINLKTITPTKLATSDYVFDIANEILKFGSYNIDLKKIIGSTNQYTPEEEKPNKGNSTGEGTGTGTGNGNGTGTGTGNGNGAGGNGVINGAENDLPPADQLYDKVKMTSIIRIVEGITQIDVDYVIYDPYNEYGSVYAEIVSPTKIDVVQLSKTETHITLDNLLADTNYKLNFIYTITKTDAETGEVDTITNTFDSFELKTKMPQYVISVYKISKIYNTLTYKVDLQSGYNISSLNIEMSFNYEVVDEEGVRQEVATLSSQAEVPSTGAKYVTGTFDITGYNLTSDTLLKLTVKSVEVTPDYTLPIDSSYTFRFGR